MTLTDHALYLAGLGFWVFPIRAGVKQPPAISGWQAAALRDPVAIRSWWEANPDHNIGISTSKFQENEALLVVDVDNKGDKNGDAEVLRLELEGRDLPDTFTQITPSGGRHLVYRVDAPVRQGTDVLGSGLDIRSRGGYIVGAGSRTANGGYTAFDREVVTAPAWLIECCGGVGGERPKTPRGEDQPPVDVPVDRARARVVHYLTVEAPPGIEGSRNDTAYKVACRCKEIGADEQTTLELMEDHWVCSPPLDELPITVASAYRTSQNAQGALSPQAAFAIPYEETPGNGETRNDREIPFSGGGTTAPPPPAPINNPYDRLNEEYAVLRRGSHILWETKDETGRPILEHLSKDDFLFNLKPEKIQHNAKEQSLAALWLDWKGRRQYDGLVFAPEQAVPKKFYNLWRGFAYEPADTGQHPAVEAFLEHARVNICRGNDLLFRWLIGYFGHLVQRPWEKPLVALVFRGAKGVGKNALIERVGALLGRHFLVAANRRYLIGQFNGHLENCLLFALDEAFWSGDKQSEGTLKDLITGGTHVIEHKGQEPYTISNKTRVVIIGNEDWLVPASHDERRYAVFDCGEGRKQDRAFFASMRVEMEKGGYRHLLRYLLDFPLAGIECDEAPTTDALKDQKHRSLDPILQWWFQCLEEGRIIGSSITGWPTLLLCDDARMAFTRTMKEMNVRSWLPSPNMIGPKIRLCSPEFLRRRKRDGDDLRWEYMVPPLAQVRAEWAAYIGHGITWGDL